MMLRENEINLELDQCLSEEERQQVLVAALLSLDADGRERLIGRLDGDTGAVLLRVLEGKSGRGWRRSVHSSPSQDRVLQEWRAAWNDWDSAIGETQEEHGKYISQDNDWESPYLDQCALADALFEFVQVLGEEDQRDIVTGIVANRASAHWQQALERAYGTWFDLVRELARQWAPSTHLQLCRECVRSDWTLAIPVLEEVIERRAFGEAGPVIEDALSSLLRYSATDGWAPADTLLVARRYPSHSRNNEKLLVRLLECWALTAEGLGEAELHHALRIQTSAQDGWTRWDPMLEAFERAAKAGFDALADRLFEDWKQLVTWRTNRDCVVFDTEAAARRRALLASRARQRSLEPTSWVPLLADTARAGLGAAGRFRESLGAWIEDVAATPDAFHRHRPFLETLTLDLDDGVLLRRASPTLYITLSGRGDDTDLEVSRRTWLERLGARRLFPAVIGAWIRHAVELPGDPRGGDYIRCALWLKIAFELDQDTGKRVLAAWRAEYGRRRNLWKELRDRGLSLDGR